MRASTDQLDGWIKGSAHRIFRSYVACTSDERLRGNVFYRDCGYLATALSYRFNVDRVQVAGILAALSPNNSWQSNQRSAIALLEGRDDQVNAYGRDLLKALWILRGAEPETVLNGPKTIAFFRLIRDGGNRYDVCIDGHMANLIRGEKKPLKGIHLTRDESESMAITIRTVAWYVGIQPCQVQAALWLAWRASDGFRQKRIDYIAAS